MTESTHKVCMPNGMVVSCKVVADVYDLLNTLKGKMQTQYIFWEFVHTCRYPRYEMTKSSKEYLQEKGYFHSDGYIKADIQNIVLFITEGYEPHLELIEDSELPNIFKTAYDLQEVE